jgi:ribose 5-phosphate isomerase A
MQTAPESPKSAAGRQAAELVRDGMNLGLGTGSTVHFALVALAGRIRSEGLQVRGIPTSLETERKARELGIPLATLAELEALDLTIDGADEIDPAFDMIKGGGGALLREKVVASISARVVIVVGPNKLVQRLGTTFALPIEVAPFALEVVKRRVVALGCDPRVRQANGRTFTTDNGNAILDCRFAHGIADPKRLALELDSLPGVVESGLFIGLAHTLVIGHDDGHTELRERS